ncbi:MAG: glycosyltransferase family 4 protein [Chloroflexota bacterium]
MRILHMVGDRKLARSPDAEGVAGVARAALEIAAAQVARGHEVHLVSVGKERWDGEWRGVHIASLPAMPWARLGINGRVLDLRLHLPYLLFARRRSFDLAHAHLYTYMRFLPCEKRVVHFHSDPFYKGNGPIGFDLKPADFSCIRKYSHAVVAVSHFVAVELEKGFAGSTRIHVVHNGVNRADFGKDRWHEEARALRREWGVKDDDAVFLFAGALVPEKGVLELAQAFARVAAGRNDVHLVLAGARSLWAEPAGSGDHGDDYEGKVKLALGGCYDRGMAHALGKVAASRMPKLYAAADVVVIPSVCREAFPLVALEAFATERPVIASQAGGLPEVVNQENGILIPPGDVAALATAMDSLAGSRRLREGLGQAGGLQARSLSWEAAACKLDSIYLSLPG